MNFNVINEKDYKKYIYHKYKVKNLDSSIFNKLVKWQNYYIWLARCIMIITFILILLYIYFNNPLYRNISELGIDIIYYLCLAAPEIIFFYLYEKYLIRREEKIINDFTNKNVR